MCAQCAAGVLPCSRASRSTTCAQIARSPSWPATVRSAGTGKESTLVGPALWRKCWFSAALSASSTMRMLRLALVSAIAAASRARPAHRVKSRFAGSLRTPLAFCSSIVTFMLAFGITQRGYRLAVVFVVGLDYALHDGVAHHVARVEPGEADAFHVAQDLGGLHQA